MHLTEIGTPPWTDASIKNKIPEFWKVHEDRPIYSNDGGMKSPHLFASWFIIQYMRFPIIIESGIFKGQGTWFFKQANPQAKIFSIDIDLNQREYISDTVVYTNIDFNLCNWDIPDRSKTLCFFDDHQNAFDRIGQLVRSGFKYAVFEDNYPTGQGDCISLKQVFDADDDRSEYLKKAISVYYEFPPIVKLDVNRWGKKWDTYPTKQAILDKNDPYYPLYKKDADNYTWLCYVELN